MAASLLAASAAAGTAAAGTAAPTLRVRMAPSLHEMLHALGLGENPPTSAEITRQVEARCGG